MNTGIEIFIKLVFRRIYILAFVFGISKGLLLVSDKVKIETGS